MIILFQQREQRILMLKVFVKSMLLIIGLAFFWILLSSIFSEDTQRLLTKKQFFFKDIAAGEMQLHPFGKRSLLIFKPTQTMLDCIGDIDSVLYDPQENRGLQIAGASYFIAIAHGTDLGCPLQWLTEIEMPVEPWCGGFKDTCRGSVYDIWGRVYKGQFAKQNLQIPDHQVIADELYISVP